MGEPAPTLGLDSDPEEREPSYKGWSHLPPQCCTYLGMGGPPLAGIIPTLEILENKGSYWLFIC